MKKSTPRLALDLARTGISVLHCNARSLWQPLGTVPLTAPDFELELARLRKTTAENFGDDFVTEIWLPSEQIMFRKVKLDTAEAGDDRTLEIKSAMAAMSRTEVNELCVFEGVTDDKGFTHVAAVSMSTWTEAVAFAEKWGFNSRTISTRLPAEGFDMPPVFTPQPAPALKKAKSNISNSNITGVIAAGFAMALMLPAALQLSTAQIDDPALLAFPAKIGVEATALETVAVETAALETKPDDSAPEVSMLSIMFFGAATEQAFDVRIPKISEPVKTEAYFEQEAREAAFAPQIQDAVAQPRDIGPEVFYDAWTMDFDGRGESVDVLRPGTAFAVAVPAKADLFIGANPAPEVVDQHAVLWVEKLPVQPAFRRTGPNFKRPALNGLRRSPGMMRLPRKLNFGPDAVPGLSMTSSGESKDFLRRTLNNIEFDDIREQAMLDFAPRKPFADERQSLVAQITADTLLLRPQKRIRSDVDEAKELERPKRRKRADAVSGQTSEQPPRAEPVIEALRPPPDPGAEPNPTPEAAETDVTDRPLQEAVLPIQAPSILLANPAPRPRQQITTTPAIQPQEQTPPLVQAPDEPVEQQPEAVATLSPSDTKTFPRPERRPNAANEVAEAGIEPATPVARNVEATVLPQIAMPRPTWRKRGATPETVASARPPEGPVSKYAVTAAISPKSRPQGLRAAAAKLRKKRSSVDAVVAKTHQPRKSVPASNLSLPSNASVKKAARIRNGINLRKISLLGVLGTSSKRRALIRLPQGSVVRVERGAKVDGWRVSAIGEQSVRLQKGSRSQVLRLPN